jgi:membrane protease YdiL (CAAX protease family)
VVGGEPEAPGPDGAVPTGRAGGVRAPVDVAWAGGRSVVDAVAVYLLAQVVIGVYVVALGGGTLPLATLVLLSPVSLLAVGLAWLRLRYGTGAWRVAGRPWRWSDVGVGLGVGVACFVGQRVLLIAIAALLAALGRDVPAVQETFQTIAGDRATAPALAVTAVVLAPAAEELLFRGVVFQGLRVRRGFWASAFVSAGLFTLAHLGDGGGPIADLIIVAGIFPLGLVFAAVMERRRSLLASVVSHAVYNAGGVALLIFATPTLG